MRTTTLQALIGEGQTGVYDSATMTTLRNVLLTQYADFDFDDPELTQDTLKAIRNWYDNSSEIGKKGTYIWENGWGNIISGVLLMGEGYYATRPVKVSSTGESGTPSGYYQDANGKWVDPSNVELGHTAGNEFASYRDWAESQGWTQSQFNDFMNNPNFYAWQEIHSNRSHMFEAKH